MNKLIDMHCHLGDKRILDNLDTEITSANNVGISKFISNALCDEEFKLINSELINKFHDSILWTAGVHPYYEKSKESDLDKIIQLCEEKQVIGIGEIGLDGRNNNEEWQNRILLQQLDIARNFELPVIFHTVKKYYELHKILKNNFPNVRGFLHAFNASQDVFETFSHYDLGFSLNAKPPQDKVIRAIIKHGNFFFETDAPYMKPPELNDDFNHLKNLKWIVGQISKKTKTDLNVLLQRQLYNFNELFEIN
ncbi:MAG: TatD family hydrolase [Candidatus Tenebribacter mawsonii]|nr:TatD family hydrolase [Candidatus Tenebribacter mawsonii]